MSTPARIVLDTHDLPEQSWCWRDDWATGWDSSYALLAKFAKLNAIDAAELVRLFVRSDTGQKTALAKNPDIDLRIIGALDIHRISLLTRCDPTNIRSAFVSELFPNSRYKASPYLRWCPECMGTGFHTPIHQIEYLSSCPLHGLKLVSKCPNCSIRMPYRLTREIFRKPYACPGCGYDLARAISDPATHALLLTQAVVDRLQDVTSLIRYEDTVLVLAFELDRESWRRGSGRFAIADADLRRDHAQYAGFVTAVVDYLRFEQTQQFSLALEAVATIGRSPSVRLNDRRKKKETRGGRPRNAARRNWGERIVEIYEVYTAIRRYLWRHVLSDHQSCCRSASKALWWNVEGGRTPRFCVAAEAFIRWRMHWEGVRIPNQLYLPCSIPPRGIAGWLDDSAPMLRFGWSSAGEKWVMCHSFSLACLASFLDLLDAAAKPAGNELSWERPSFSGKYERYWAIAGNDTRQRPLTFFQQIQAGIDLRELNHMYRAGSAHYGWHSKQVAEIVR